MFRASRFVRVSAHDDLEPGGDRIEVQGVNVVEDVYRSGIEVHDFGFRQGHRPRFGVHVSAHGKNRGKPFQRFKDLWISYVACVNN